MPVRSTESERATGSCGVPDRLTATGWWTLAAIAATYTAVVLRGTRLIPAWGQWYSEAIYYRQQTEALLHGALALARTPGALTHDLIWSNGGVHHPWGLGVPLWRLPFEVLARLFGQAAFPDRIALGVAFFGTALLVLRACVRTETAPSGGSTLMPWLASSSAGMLAGLTLLCFPPIMTLCRARFAVYEEAVTYAYLYELVLFAGLLLFRDRPSRGWFAVLGLLAGAGGLVRPTVLAYGGATLVLGWVLARRAGILKRHLVAGLLLASIGPGALFTTNAMRFGAPLEFGHHLTLNFQLSSSTYPTRFDYPYRYEPPLSAARELFGTLFLVRKLDGDHWLGEEMFPGQSPTPRLREFYFTTFDVTYLPPILLGWGLALWGLRGRRADGRWSRNAVAGVWSLLAFGPMYVFYMWVHCIASRYSMDFAAAFATAVAINVWSLSRVPMARSRRLLMIGVVLWVGVQNLTAQRTVVSWDPGSYEKMQARMAFPPVPPQTALPARYQAGENLGAYGIPFNGDGWHRLTWGADPAVILFVNDPRFLDVRVDAAEPAVDRRECGEVRANIGFEPLVRESWAWEGETCHVRFQAPGRPAYRHGVQVAFLGLVKPAEFGRTRSRFRLLNVGWR